MRKKEGIIFAALLVAIELVTGGAYFLMMGVSAALIAVAVGAEEAGRWEYGLPLCTGPHYLPEQVGRSENRQRFAASIPLKYQSIPLGSNGRRNRRLAFF